MLLFCFSFNKRIYQLIDFVVAIFVFFLGLSTATIRNVSLLVDPPSVRRGQHATFICSYDLGGAPLYSVKFYRGVYEFYRYSPGELPTSKVFPFVGFNIDVSIPIDYGFAQSKRRNLSNIIPISLGNCSICF